MDKKYFGVMIDCSRNSVMKPTQIKKFIDDLSLMGYNMLMVYTEDIFEIEDEPLFGYLRGRYTKEDLKDIVNYGETKGIELIPCIQTLGHLEHMFRWGHFSEIRDRGSILLADEEKTYALIEKMLDVARECFKSDHIHIGCDEAYDLGLGKYKDIHGFTDPFKILDKHLRRVSKMATDRGFKPIIWSDMYYQLASGKYLNYDNPDIITEDIAKLVPPEVELCYWDYFTKNKKDCDTMVKSHLHFHNDIWFASAAHSWTGFTPHNALSLLCLKNAIECAGENGLKNFLITTWGDDGGETSRFSLLPPLFYASEIYRGNRDMDDIKEKFEKLFGIAFDDFMKLDYPSTKDEKINPHYETPDRCLLFNDPFAGIYDDLVTEDYPKWEKNFADHAKELHALENNAEYGYLFSSAAALCELMSVKVALGYKTRKAYKAGDKAALKNLLPEYIKAVELTENFYQKFKTVWHTENKAYGFEVQDMRLGGLKKRLKYCHNMIKLYIEGKLDKIDQLEDEILETSGGDMFEYRYGRIVSVNSITDWHI